MRRTRCSLRLSIGGARQLAGAVLTLWVGVACGGGAAAPTPTVVPVASPPTAPAASPQRPALASPVPSPSVAAAAVVPTPTTEVASETYEVQSGDTLASIAEQFYNDGTQWRRIYDANKDTIGSDPDKLKIGTKLKIPPKQ